MASTSAPIASAEASLRRSWMTAFPPGLEHPVHLVQRLYRLREVLEGGPADDEVERLRLERQRGGIAPQESDRYPRSARVLGGHPDERRADVQPDHPVR